MELLELLNPDPKNPDSWRRIVEGEVFFEALSRTKGHADWAECQLHLDNWFKKLKLCLEQGQFQNHGDGERAFDQWRHAAKLFVCARFAAEHGEAVRQIAEGNFRKFVERFNEYKSSLRGNFAVLDPTDDTLPNLCYVFLEEFDSGAGVFSEVRRIPFATASDRQPEGRIHMLELVRVRSHSKAIRNPRVFPHADVYAESISDDFTAAIDLALELNIKAWDDELAELQKRIDELKQKPKHEVNASELRGLESDLRSMKYLGSISRYGVFWDVKPFMTDRELREWRQYRENVRLAISRGDDPETISPPGKIKPFVERLKGESIGLAAYVGIYFALRNKFPDQRGILSAELVRGEKVEIKSVGLVAQKMRAAMRLNVESQKSEPDELPPFDDFGIHEDNWKNEAEREELLSIVQDKNFQIIVLDSSGRVKETFNALV